MTIKQKLTILVAGFGLLVVILLSTLFYLSMRHLILEQQYESLEAAVEPRVTELRHIIALRKGQTRQFASLFSPEDLRVENRESLQTAVSEYLEDQERLHASPGGHGLDLRFGPIEVVGVWDRDGEILANSREELIGRRMPETYLDRVREFGTWFSGYRYDPLTGRNYLMFLEAISDPENDTFAGAVIFKVRPEMLNRIVQGRQGLGETGEILLVQEDRENPGQIHFVTDLREEPGSLALIGGDRAEPSQFVLQGEDGRGIYRDYRNMEVSAVWKWIPDLDWGIVGKMDTAEFFQPVNRTRGGILLLGLFVLLPAILIAWLLARSLSEPIEQLTSTFERISRGEAAEPVPVNRRDELGQLAASANRTLAYLSRIKTHAKQMAKGNDDRDLEPLSDRDELGLALNRMTVGLRKNRTRIENLLEDSRQQTWDLKRHRHSLEKVNRELEESRARTQAILETSVDAIITIDDEGTVLSFNPAAEKMFGYDREEVIGRNASLLMPAPYSEREETFLTDFLDADHDTILGQGREAVGRRKDGSVFPIDLAISEVQWKGERIFAGIIRDLSARKELERRLLEVGEMERQRIGRELHDGLGQMLTGIRMVAESLARRMDDGGGRESDKIREVVEMVREADEYARNLARGMVRMDLHERGIAEALENLCRTVERLFSIRCRCSVNSRLRIRNQVAAMDLYRIVQEAITNAVKHGEATRIRVRLSRLGDHLIMIVEDNGHGFRRGWEKRRGMGVEIMQYRARSMNGTLEIVRTDEGHTRVRCTIPVESLQRRVSDSQSFSEKTTEN